MAAEWDFSQFTSEQKRSWISQNISRDAWETESGAAILRELQEWGLGIREGDFYSIRREVLGLGYYEEQIRNLRPESLVPRGWMRSREHVDLTCNAQYRYQVRVIDNDTGEESEIVRAIAVDRHWTKEEAEDFIRNLYVMPEAKSNYTVQDVELFEVWTKPEGILTR